MIYLIYYKLFEKLNLINLCTINKIKPNIITLLNFICGLSFFFIKPMKIKMLIIFKLCIFLDYFDGYLARKTNNITKLGSILDICADLCSHLGLLYCIYKMKQITYITYFIILFSTYSGLCEQAYLNKYYFFITPKKYISMSSISDSIVIPLYLLLYIS